VARSAAQAKKAAATKPADVVNYKGIKAFKSSHPDIKRIKRQEEKPTIHGNKIWSSSFVMMDFLEEFPPGEDKVILDVGCGWGVLSCFLAKKFNAAVLGVDADAAVEPYFMYHAEKNGVDLSFVAATIDDIEDDVLEDVDVIIGTDICFWDSLAKDWEKLIKRAMKAGVEQVYLGDPGRSPFWSLSKKCEKKYDADVYSHSIKQPVKGEKYVLEIDRRED
jgi:predicted nicotinamide N-methyase